MRTKGALQGDMAYQIGKVFPGYLFFDTGDPDELSRQLRKEKIMAQNDKLFVLTPEDVQCLLFFGRTGVFPMSQGIIVNGRVIILSGPLVGEESRIRKVDRHKRRAWLQIKLFGKPYTVVVGLEISQKTAQEENSPSNTSLKARTDRTSAGVFHKKRKNYRKEMPKRDTVIETLRQKAADLWLK